MGYSAVIAWVHCLQPFPRSRVLRRMLLVRDMKDLRNQPAEDLSPASYILLRKFLMPEHSNNHPLQGGRPRGRWLPVWAPLLLQLCHPSHCVLPMTPQNQRGTHTHTRVRSMGAVRELGGKPEFISMVLLVQLLQGVAGDIPVTCNGRTLFPVMQVSSHCVCV